MKLVVYFFRLYDSFSGEFLWESNEHEGAGFQFWTMSKFPGCCGLYGNSGMWIIRSQKCSDHACFMARGIFPVQTNADEVYMYLSLINTSTIFNSGTKGAIP